MGGVLPDTAWVKAGFYLLLLVVSSKFCMIFITLWITTLDHGNFRANAESIGFLMPGHTLACEGFLQEPQQLAALSGTLRGQTGGVEKLPLLGRLTGGFLQDLTTNFLSGSNSAEQLRYRQFERLRNLLDIDQRHIALSTFDPSDVRPVQLAHIRKGFLGHSELVPPLTNCFAEPNSNVFHLPLSVILEASGFMCPRTMSIIEVTVGRFYVETEGVSGAD